MSDVIPRLDVRSAVDAGFRAFRELFDEGDLTHILLEGVEYSEKDNHWIVVIGFDSGRRKETSSPFGFGERSTEYLRDARKLTLDGSTGALIRMSKG